MRGASFEGVRKNQRGYTLPRALTAVAIAGVLAAISLVILLALLDAGGSRLPRTSSPPT